MNWEPIGSAPRNGTRILAAWDDPEVWDQVEIVFWNDIPQVWSGGDGEAFTLLWRGAESPTHWMHLPDWPVS